MFEYEYMEVQTGYYSAPGADMGGSATVDFFFAVTDGWFAEISDLHGSQYNIICNNHLWEYPDPVPGVLSKTKICLVWHNSNAFFGYNRNVEGLCNYSTLSAFFAN